MNKPREQCSAELEKEQILADHRELGQLLHRLEIAATVGEVTPLLDSLQVVVRRHFAREDVSDGLFEIIESRAPRHAGRISDLRQQHGVLLEVLDGLVRRAHQAGQGESLLAEVVQFSRDMRAHEREESSLLIDALSTDLGTVD